MKRIGLILVCLLMLMGCASEQDLMDRVLSTRSALQESEGCRFKTTVTADYGDTLQTFVLACDADSAGEIRFHVLAPDTIAGITGTISGDGGKLTFDDEMLAFSPLADGYLAPISAPWVLMRALLGGYLSACGKTDTGLIVSMNDTYADDAFGLEICLGERDLPVWAEIIWQGRRILSMKIENFEIL